MRDRLYANEFDYDIISLDTYTPDYYEAALDAFVNAGYKVSLLKRRAHQVLGTATEAQVPHQQLIPTVLWIYQMVLMRKYLLHNRRIICAIFVSIHPAYQDAPTRRML